MISAVEASKGRRTRRNEVMYMAKKSLGHVYIHLHELIPSSSFFQNKSLVVLDGSLDLNSTETSLERPDDHDS